MKLLLDENVDHPLLEPIRWLLRHGKSGSSNVVDHVDDVRWKSIKDKELYAKASRYGYDAVLSNDVSQLADPDICVAIKRSGLSVVFYEVTGNGMAAHAAAAGAVLHCIRQVVADLVVAKQQRIVFIHPLKGADRQFDTVDPDQEYVSDYWPGRRQYDRHKPPPRSKNAKR